MPQRLGSKLQYFSFARWMDDIWLFTGDAALARRAQLEIQSVAQTYGLMLNTAKTAVVEGADLSEKALQIQHSAVDDALTDIPPRLEPLEELIDSVLDQLEMVPRTTVKFMATRMVDSGCTYRVQDLIRASPRMPHAADSFTPLFRSVFQTSGLQDWYLEYVASDWASHEWSVAQYMRLFATAQRPRKPLRMYAEKTIRDANTGVQMLAVASQRLATWDPPAARDACRQAYTRVSSPLARRIVALAAISAGEGRSMVRKWLNADRENAPTLKMLNRAGFAPPKVRKDFAA